MRRKLVWFSLLLVYGAMDPACGTAQSAFACLVADASISDVDLGWFARVVTSDPARTDGARANRLAEFHAEDVFLTTELAPRPEGTYAVPTDPSVGGTIGLEWAERRVLRQLELEFVSPPEVASAAVLEYWSSSGREDSWGSIGQTPWQGCWEALPARMETSNGRCVATIPDDAIPEFQTSVGVLRIRWRFAPTDAEIMVRRPRAFGASRWQREALRLETEEPTDTTVEVYNGLLIDREGEHRVLHRTSDLPGPWTLSVMSSITTPSKADRTLLRCRLPAGLATVAVEDVLAAGQVYVRELGLLVSRADLPGGFVEYRDQFAGAQTILSRVRDLPDQSFDQAMRTLWRPEQNHGPTMLSLACDNAKFIVEREGAVRWGTLTLRPQFPVLQIAVERLDFGILGMDTTVRPSQTAVPLPMRIADRTYAKGLGLHAHAELTVRLDGRYDSFEAEVGVLPSGEPGGTVVLQVDVDGQRRFDSGIVRQGDAPRKVHVPLSDARQLTLRTTDAGDGILNDAANWAEARLRPRGSAGDTPLYLSDLYRRQDRPHATRTRQLADDRWLPVIVNTSQMGDVAIHQRTWVAPEDDSWDNWDGIAETRALGVAEFLIENRGTEPADVTWRLDVAPSPETPDSPPLETRTARARLLWMAGTQLVAALDLAELAPLSAKSDTGGVEISGRLAAAAHCRVIAYLPAWKCEVHEQVSWPAPAELRERVERYWRTWLDPAMQIEVPEPLLEDFFRATQVHCLMAARNEAAGQRVAPWIAADAYGPLDTEAHAVILGMSLAGHREFARRGLDFFVASYSPDGMLAKGYTLMGTGQHLWTLGEHYSLHPDPAWRDQIAPEIAKAGQWIVRQTEKTKRMDARGEVVPEYGLAPPGVLADWDRYAYYLYANAYYCAGLEAVGRLLADSHPRDAETCRQAAGEYRAHVQRAFQWQRARMPVVPLRDGTWVSPSPSSLYCFGLTREFFGGVSAIGHDVEVGGQHLIPLGLLDPRGTAADAITNYLEDRWFLIDGIFDVYPAAANEADWFNCGGFAKLQPHYARTTDIHALRDDIRPFIRTYFNTFPVLLNRENLTYWEHLNHGGAWNKTHESAWFLQMTRTMLVMERGDELWLAPFVTTAWFEDGKHVAARQVPTRFGSVSFSLRSAVADDYIEAHLEPPSRQPPTRIVLRVRHPTGKPMQSVIVNGRTHADFDAAAQLVFLCPTAESQVIRIEY